MIDIKKAAEALLGRTCPSDGSLNSRGTEHITSRRRIEVTERDTLAYSSASPAEATDCLACIEETLHSLLEPLQKEIAELEQVARAAEGYVDRIQEQDREIESLRPIVYGRRRYPHSKRTPPEQHGTARVWCACPGCREAIPGCWTAGLCRVCLAEDCDHRGGLPLGHEFRSGLREEDGCREVIFGVCRMIGGEERRCERPRSEHSR